MNNTPYTVPEGFFEKVESNAVNAASKVSARRRLAFGFVCTCVVLTLVFIPFRSNEKMSADAVASSAEYTDEEILEIYDYDIFLNNNF